MKKGKKRELTLEQLQKRKEIANEIWFKFQILGLFLIFGLVLILGLIVIFEIIPKHFAGSNLILIDFPLTLAYGEVIFRIFNKIDKKLNCKIESMLEQIEIDEIKQMAQKGNLKGTLIPIVTDKKAIAIMLVKNMESVVCNLEGTSLMLEFNSKKDFTIFTWELPIEEWLKEETIELILDHYIDTIKIEDSEEEKMKVSILGEGFCYENEEVTDDDLLTMFKLRG